jgi:hypothetical protein
MHQRTQYVTDQDGDTIACTPESPQELHLKMRQCPGGVAIYTAELLMRKADVRRLRNILNKFLGE